MGFVDLHPQSLHFLDFHIVVLLLLSDFLFQSLHHSIEIVTGNEYMRILKPWLATKEVFFFGALEGFLGAPPGGGGRILEEMGGMDEKDKVGWEYMFLERL